MNRTCRVCDADIRPRDPECVNCGAPIARPSRSDCWEALRTAIVLAEREMLPGPKLIEEWKQMLPNAQANRLA